MAYGRAATGPTDQPPAVPPEAEERFRVTGAVPVSVTLKRAQGKLDRSEVEVAGPPVTNQRQGQTLEGVPNGEQVIEVATRVRRDPGASARNVFDAGRVVSRGRGRDKLHYLNTVQIRLIHDRRLGGQVHRAMCRRAWPA